MARTVDYVCFSCGRAYSIELPRWRCDCNGHLNLAPSRGLKREEILSNRRSLWRYQSALALDEAPTISLGEGFTPLVKGMWNNVPVHFKLEYCSVSGSFKDRGISVMINYLKNRGVTSIVEDSSGNGGASLATYAAAAGFDCRILMPASTSQNKISQIAASGAEPVLVRGTRQQVAEAVLSEPSSRFYASHNWQAFFIEGVKTLGYEIWENLGFAAPDNIVVPLGGGSNLIGCWIAFSDLLRNGEADAMPRLFGVQPANCCPLHLAFEAGQTTLPTVTPTPTIAEGIAMTHPIRVHEVLTAVKESRGQTVSVSEYEIGTALRSLGRQGFFVEPTSAAAAAGLSQLIRRGTIGTNQRTVVVLTGSGLKASDTIRSLLE